MENHGGMISTGETPDSSTRALWKSYQQSHLVAKQEELAKEMMNLALRSIFVHTSKGSLTCRKIFRHGADGFTSPPKEGVLRNFISLKNPSLSLSRSGFNPQILGQTASTLTDHRGRLRHSLLIVKLFSPLPTNSA